MKKQKSSFLVLMLIVASAPWLHSCSDEEEKNLNVEFTVPSDLVLSNDGSSGIVSLALSAEVDWYVAAKGGDTSWCEITPASGTGKGQFVVTASPNANREARSIELEVTVGRASRSFTVYQKDTLLVSLPDAVMASNEGATLTIPIEANTTWEVIKPDWRANWVTFTPAAGVGKGEVTCVVAANSSLRARSVELIISAGSISRVITISQQEVTPTSASDSLALVALHKATDGAYWSSPWKLDQPVSTWKGVFTATVDGQLRVTRLLLPGRNLDGMLPPEIGNFTMLEKLDLSENSLRGSIPEEIGRLSKLTILNITGNKFEGEIPLSIKNLEKLEELDTQNNRLKVFPVEICQLTNLKVLHLENNEISSLPGEITKMSSLEYLYLNRNRLTTLPKGLDKLPQLIYLHADNNLITELPEELGKLVRLVSLNLSNNLITGAIPAGISKMKSLKYLYLSNNQFNSDLPAGMEQLVSLESIEAHDCGLTGNLPELGAFARLTKLWMSGNRLTGQLTEELSRLSQLEQLILDDNKLTGTLPVDALGNKANLPNLKMLGLANNEIRGTIPAGLASRLTAWPKMTVFRLNGNYLEGPVPKTFAGNIGNSSQFNFAVNLFPQRNGVTLQVAQ